MSEERKWTHDALIGDLSTHLKAEGTMVWMDMQLGPSGSPRPDVYLMHKSFTRPNPIAYEVKISRQDFLSDVTSGKWISYLKYAYGVIFAVPAGLVTVKEVPEKCGLLYRHDKAWRAAKRVTIDPIKLPQDAMIKLLIDGVHREGAEQRKRHWNQYDSINGFNKKFGAEAARWVHDAASVKAKVDHAEATVQTMYAAAREQCERMKKQALSDMPEMWAAMLKILDLPEGSNEWKIRDAIGKLRAKKDHPSKVALSRLLDSLDRLVTQNRPVTLEESGDDAEES